MASARKVAVVINPVSGARGNPEVARERAIAAADFLGTHGLEPRVFVTDRPGHGHDLARAQAAQGVDTVVAWGGDGTVNEVASALAFTDAALAVVPSGSGNGLARYLGLPFEPGRALAIALDGEPAAMDVGELDGHLFVIVAGIGLDARVAHRFGDAGVWRRGFLRYLEITAHELFAFEADDYDIVIDGATQRSRALMVALANARQYGNGALIAPDARIDDGALDVVVVDDRPRLLAVAQAPMIFLGLIAGVAGVTIRRGSEASVTGTRPIAYHVDGEAFVGGTTLTAKVHPAALKIRTPPGYSTKR
ncbi:MAG: diacylglycerol kinase family protein [Vicinamibacterales bacterium]